MIMKILSPFFIVFALSACASSPATEMLPDGGSVVIIDCTHDPRVLNYAPPISVPSASGALDFTLLSSNPAPPARGTNTWSMKITNAAAINQPNMAVNVLPFMPDHGHGTSITPSMTPNADGTYTVQPLYLFMAGVWRVTFTTVPDAGQGDTANFFFCVEG